MDPDAHAATAARPPGAGPNPYRRAFDEQCAHFASTVRDRPAAARIADLKRLRTYMFAHQDELRDALFRDFGKPAAEVDATEVYPVLTEIRHAVRHLREWMRPRHVDAPPALLGTRSLVVCEPLGVVLIVAPWNFPFMLAAAPLVAALAAGNCVVLKPSELTPHTAAFIERMAGALFPPERVAVVQGGPAETAVLLELPFHHIYFTGSTRVGRIMMEAAAKNLISVTLELGGKCPAIVDGTARVEDAARKLVWGKFLNAGQACVAPDYVLVAEPLEEPLLAAMERALATLHPRGPRGGRRYPDLCRIVDDGHFRRLAGLLEQARRSGAVVRAGGELDPAERLIAPTILSRVDPASDLMREEIFGPLLPVLPFRTLDEAVGIVEGQPRPLSLYLFSRSRHNVDRVLRHTASGGAAINETMVHFLHPYLPFGGVNESGIGRSHGYSGFRAFSNERSVLRQGTRLSTIRPIYPPYTSRVRKVLDLMLRYL